MPRFQSSISTDSIPFLLTRTPDWFEQRLLFSEFAPHLQRIALFKVNTGVRAGELRNLCWEWEQRIPELGTPEFKRTVFVLPETVTKNQEARVVVLNDAAQSIVEEVRGQHPTHMFTYADREGKRHPMKQLYCSGWRLARKRASARYDMELSRPLPASSESASTM